MFCFDGELSLIVSEKRFFRCKKKQFYRVTNQTYFLLFSEKILFNLNK